MATGIDHIVIAVQDLERAVNDYEGAGFTVTPGGEHSNGVTHNALVAFADGTYFELIAWKRSGASGKADWWRRLQAGEGFVDYALRTDDLDAEVNRLRDAGLDVPDPESGGRLRPDGLRVEWRNLRFGPGSSPSLPFYCHSTNDRSLRVPSGGAAEHLNGVRGITGVTIGVVDIDAAARDYARLTESDGNEVKPSLDGAVTARRFPVGGVWLELVSASPGSALATSIANRDEVPVQVTLSGLDSRRGPIEPSLTHGANLIIG